MTTAMGQLLGCRDTPVLALPHTTSLSQPPAQGTAEMPILQMQKLGPREAEQISCGHTAVNGEPGQILQPGLGTCESTSMGVEGQVQRGDVVQVSATS